MVEVTGHVVNPQNDTLTIEAVDEPGAGGAHHHYLIQGFDTTTNAACPFKERHGEPAKHSTVLFQNGPIPEVGVNGVTHEALLAIVKHRLESFQAGPFACEENAEALKHVKQAISWLHSRTIKRMERGVEGKNEK